MAYKFFAALLGVMSVVGAAMAADPVRTAPPSTGNATVNIESSNRDHIDQDARSKTQPNVPTNGVGGTGGGRLQTGGNGTGTMTNNGTINDKR